MGLLIHNKYIYKKNIILKKNSLKKERLDRGFSVQVTRGGAFGSQDGLLRKGLEKALPLYIL